MRVLLAGGGSGGSAAPVIATAEALRRRDPGAEFLYVGTTSGPESGLVRAAGLPYRAIHTGRLRRYATWRNLTDPWLVLAGVVQAVGIIRSFRPDVAFGAGGFATVPPLLAARLLGVPIVVHQQDVQIGLANRMLAPFARFVTVAFPETTALFSHANVRVTGNPVRESIHSGNRERARAFFSLPPDKRVVLITGGGTGALRLNQLAYEAARHLVDDYAVVHLTGAGKTMSGWEHPLYRQYEFLTAEMADALALADLVVTRAGMSALSEIAALKKAAIVVPMPGSHQMANARMVERHGAGVVVQESELTSDELVAIARELLGNRPRAEALGRAAGELLPGGAADAVAKVLLDASPRGST